MRTLMAHYLVIGVAANAGSTKGNQDPQLELLSAERCLPLYNGVPKSTRVFFQPPINGLDGGFNIDRWKGLGFNVLQDVAIDGERVHGTDIPDEVQEVIENWVTKSKTTTTDDQISTR
jgi:hypothetical protein